MECPYCQSESKRFGKHCNGLQRYRCLSCKKTFTEDHKRSFRVEDCLSLANGILALQLLLEGFSVRTVEALPAFGTLQFWVF